MRYKFEVVWPNKQLTKEEWFRLEIDELLNNRPVLVAENGFEIATHLPRFYLRNNNSLFINAGKYFRSYPKSERGPYRRVEVAHPDFSPPDFWNGFSYNGLVYNYVPIEYVKDLIQSYGGIDYRKTFKNFRFKVPFWLGNVYEDCTSICSSD